MNEHFKKQLDEGATDQFFYGIMRDGNMTIQRHRGTLDTMPNLVYVGQASENVPMFKDAE